MIKIKLSLIDDILKRKVLYMVLFIWICLSMWYMAHTPFGPMNICMCYDCATKDGHIGYTEIIVREHRIPNYFENGIVFHHPPLYYLINSLLAPNSLISGDRMIHVNLVRTLGLIYGILTLLLIWWFLSQLTNNEMYKSLVLLFIGSTPRFIFIFTSYNHDSLVIFLSLATFFLAYKLSQKWSNWIGLALLLVASAGLYTKFNVAIPIISIIAICSKNLFKKKSPSPGELKTIFILILSLSSITPWLYIHNFSSTNKFLACVNKSPSEINSNDLKTTLDLVFRVPILGLPEKAWEDPWIHTSPHPANKRNDYWAYMWICSVISSAIFTYPSTNTVWVLLFVHLIIYLFAIFEFFRSKNNSLIQLAAFIISFTHICHLIFLTFGSFWPPNMDHRYIAWTWLGWAVLYTSTLIKKEESNLSNYFSKILMFGTILNIFVVIVVQGYLG